MASESIFCSICTQNQLNMKAERYCPECEEFLCVDCNRHHSMSKSSKHHSSNTLQDYRELPTFVQSVKGYCDEHQMQYEMFCTEHNCQLCVQCLKSHKDCISVSTMKEVVKDVQASSTVSDIEKSILDLTEYIRRIKDKLEQDKKNTSLKKVAILYEVKLVRQKINEHLDFLEKTLVDQMTDVIQKNVKRVDNLLNDIKSREKYLKNISGDLQKTKQLATEYQAFIAMKHIKESVYTEESYIESLKKGSFLDYMNINLKTNKTTEHLNSLTNLGEIQEVSVPCVISLSPRKETQAQIGPVSRNIHNISLELYDRIKINSKQETKGCLVLPDSAIVITEYSQARMDSVNVYRNDSVNSLQSISSKSYDVNDAVLFTHDTFVATSDGYQPVLLVVDYTRDKIVQTLPAGRKRHGGITFLNNMLFYCEHGIGINCNNLDTKVTKTILSNSKVTHTSYIDSFKKQIYYTYDDNVAACDTGGNLVWDFQDAKILRHPRGIAVDRDGYVYVVGEETENLVVISPAGTEGRQLLSRTDGIRRPRAMKYDPKRHCLLICNDRDLAFLYQIK